jgi:transcription elongation factor Elf1
MTKKQRLCLEAKNAATRRGHTLVRWTHSVEFWDGKYSVSHCSECGAHVQTNINPAPNEIDVSGEAISRNCPGVMMPSWMSFDVRNELGFGNKTAREWKNAGR